MEEVENMTDKELANRYKTLFQKIEVRKGGYGRRELYQYEAVKEEVNKRNLRVKTKCEIVDRESGEVIA